MTFITLKNIHGDLIRVNPQHITWYEPVGSYTRLGFINDSHVDLMCDIQELDTLLSELFYFVKPNRELLND